MLDGGVIIISSSKLLLMKKEKLILDRFNLYLSKIVISNQLNRIKSTNKSNQHKYIILMWETLNEKNHEL